MTFTPDDPIPPGSVIRLIKTTTDTPCWRDCVGSIFDVLFYSRQDGPDVIWLRDVQTKEVETIDHEGLAEYFEILSVNTAATSCYDPPLDD